ncbi:PREDICTED: gamma-aminobutyric acid type B receptor subunit 2-like [Priapulus caudatus]|uniref:Gamma-aminobutyric acid type B receptor subunit 2-like n=1 Tax=Priapulus caudatus TaxID=37621 RepID=A0ABM1F2W1_PRICU|nr:PREDICTED: gamma-aminobutyric acid type B receptor subunit 2-like [Priapulus caudatus]
MHRVVFNGPTKVMAVGAGCSTCTEATAGVSHFWNLMQCNCGKAINEMHRVVFHGPTKLMAVGAGCSTCTEATAGVSHFWNLMQVTPTSASPALSDRKRFPKFFRTATSDLNMNAARIELMKYMGWKRIAIIQESQEIFTLVAEALIPLLKKENFELITTETFHPSKSIDNLIKRDARIIFGGFYMGQAMKIFCRAYKRGLYGPKIQWIIGGWYDSKWWNTQDPSKDSANCTMDQILTAMNGYIATGAVHWNAVEERGLADITAEEFRAEFNRFTNYTEPFGYKFAAWSFDCVWAAAVCLNNTVNDLEPTGHRIEEFTYDHVNYTDLMMANMAKTDFLGVKGRVKFDEFGTSFSDTRVAQLQGENDVTIAILKVGSSFTDDTLVNPFQFHSNENKPPVDGPQLFKERFYVPRYLYFFMCFVSMLGILCTLVPYLNVVNRKARLIKMSSPNLNNIILCGCLLNYIYVFFEGLNENYPVVMFCTVRNFLLVAGFSLAFGALFAKTWRVHAIFTEKNVIQKKAIKDSKLIAMVGVLLMMNMTVLILSLIIDPPHVKTLEARPIISPHDSDVINQYLIDTCSSKNEVYFMAALYIIQGVLLFGGCFLAYETRKVKVEALNDSQLIGVCIYNAVVLSFMGVAITFILPDNPPVKYGLVSSFIIGGTTFTAFLLFLPKLKRVRNLNAQIADSQTEASTSASRINASTISQKPPAMLAIELKITKDRLRECEAKIEVQERVIRDLRARIV